MNPAIGLQIWALARGLVRTATFLALTVLLLQLFVGVHRPVRDDSMPAREYPAHERSEPVVPPWDYYVQVELA